MRAARMHFSSQDLMAVGQAFCESILEFCDPDQRKMAMVVEELERMLPHAEEVDIKDLESKLQTKKRGYIKKKKFKYMRIQNDNQY